MKCGVNGIERQGKGFSKKEAKQMSAMEVLKVLMGKEADPIGISENGEPMPTQFKSNEAMTSVNCSDTLINTSFESIGSEAKNIG